MNKWIRQIHRWMSVLFTLFVVANFAVMAQENPPEWVAWLPLAPLAVLFFTGLYLFVLPWTRKGRASAASAGTQAAPQ